MEGGTGGGRYGWRYVRAVNGSEGAIYSNRFQFVATASFGF